jgi:hypothetical protein
LRRERWGRRFNPVFFCALIDDMFRKKNMSTPQFRMQEPRFKKLACGESSLYRNAIPYYGIFDGSHRRLSKRVTVGDNTVPLH